MIKQKIILIFAGLSRRFKKDLIQTFRRLKHVLKKETKETKQMIKIYHLMLENKATVEQISWANKQLRESLKTIGLGVLIVLPFSPVTLPIIAGLSKKLGIRIFPNSFEDDFNSEK